MMNWSITEVDSWLQWHIFLSNIIECNRPTKRQIAEQFFEMKHDMMNFTAHQIKQVETDWLVYLSRANMTSKDRIETLTNQPKTERRKGFLNFRIRLPLTKITIKIMLMLTDKCVSKIYLYIIGMHHSVSRS